VCKWERIPLIDANGHLDLQVAQKVNETIKAINVVNFPQRTELGQ
jgi:hypothetical protein